MKISVARRAYLIEIEVRKFTPKTIRCYRNNLDLFLRFCEKSKNHGGGGADTCCRKLPSMNFAKAKCYEILK